MKVNWKGLLPAKLNEKDADMWMISVREREQWGTEVKAYNLAIDRCIEALRQAEANGLICRVLSTDQITEIILIKELMPTVCEDSGQPEWSVGEARELATEINKRMRNV